MRGGELPDFNKFPSPPNLVSNPVDWVIQVTVQGGIR